ncbi:MAG TPA: hypothetical protein VHR86_08780 [Armatimonadota bacterium]|nr:hypothetical protein [Armatimonadota bacterium]
MTRRPLRAGDIIRLASPSYGEPPGDCVVLADQQGELVWFAKDSGGPAFVARRGAVKLVARQARTQA